MPCSTDRFLMRRETKRMRICEFVNGAVAAVLFATSSAYAHGGRPGHIDEGPGPGVWITIVMVVSWVVIAVGVVFFVLRFVLRKGSNKPAKDKRGISEL
jgi:hypothetical protein